MSIIGEAFSVGWENPQRQKLSLRKRGKSETVLTDSHMILAIVKVTELSDNLCLERIIVNFTGMLVEQLLKRVRITWRSCDRFTHIYNSPRALEKRLVKT